MKDFLNIRLKSAILLLFFPVFLAFTLEFFIQEVNFTTFPNFVENILFAVVFLVLVNVLLSLGLPRKIIALLIIVYYLIFIIETGLYLLFQTRMNAAYIHVIVNTNFQEANEFSGVYFENNLYWLLLFFIPLFKFFPKRIFKTPKFKLNQLLINISVLIIVGIVFKIYHLGKWNLPYISTKSFIEYRNQINNVNKFQEENQDIEVERIEDNETIVVVIGESTTRNHMGIYGYVRETTPRLKQLSDSLIIYNDVISSNVYTTASISDAFTLSNYETPENKYSLIDFIKKSGYKVFWLSNQRAVGLNDNLVSRLASSSDETMFLSYNDFRHVTLYDEVLLKELVDKLKYQERKVIFLHLVGTHYDYSKRYPDNFSMFNSEDNSKRNIIKDTYDNAVLYNDYIVSEIIKLVSKTSKRSAVVYFSDHGDEVYDTTDYFGHFDDKPTRAMYEIPFLVYLSEDFIKPKDFVIDTSRKYMLDDFPHSLTHLIGIESDLLEKNRSVFSLRFDERKRVIRDSIDFDVFKTNINK